MSRNYPYLLISEGKHANTYYMIEDANDVAKASVEILREWDQWQFLQPYDPYFYGDEADAIKSGLTKEQARAMPEPYRKKALKTLQGIEAKREQHKKDVRYYELVRQVLDAPKEEAWKMITPKGGNLASTLRRLRQGTEYQRIEEEWVTTFESEAE